MSSHHELKMAKRHHQAGNLAEAEKIYRKILIDDPDDPDVLRLLGNLETQRGNLDAALDLFGRAIQAKPDDFESHRALAGALSARGRTSEAIDQYQKVLELQGNDAKVQKELALVLLAAGRLEEAAASLSNAVQIEPKDAGGYNELAAIRLKQNRFDEAIAAASKAIAINEKLASAHANLADAFIAKGKTQESSAAYRRALQLKPDDFLTTNKLADLLRDLGNLDEAAVFYSKATQLQPSDPVPQFKLGAAYYKAGRLEQALAAFARAADAKPDFLQAHVDMAIVLASLHRFPEALASHAKAAALQPQAAVTHLAMGEIFFHQQKMDEAIEHLRRAVAGDETLSMAWNDLGTALGAQGKFEEAAACFRTMLQLRPNSSAAYHNLASTGKGKFTADEIKNMAAIVDKPNLSVPDRISLGFALGRVLDDLGRYDEAFARYAEANALVKRSRALAGDQYYPRAVHRMIDEMLEVLTPSFFQERRDWGDPSEVPVFVVGMPRSGTTLVHQIAAGHPQVYGAGELRDIGVLMKSLGAADARGTLALKLQAIQTAAQEHLQRLQELNPKATRIIDKTPGNLTGVGLIALLFPRARVIFCRRDPRDTCLSCFFQFFTVGNAFSFDLAHCGHWQIQNDRLAQHWLRVLPLQMMEIQYETLVGDLEGQSRRLVEFLGLPWDPACLDFHRTRGDVLTASVWQVRQPIYSKSVGRWRHYEKHLGPLLQALGK